MSLRGRPLTAGERALVVEVFGSALDAGGVRLHRWPLGGLAITLGRRVFLPRGWLREDFAASGAQAPWTDLTAQALLIHELVHVWQFQTRPVRTLASWAGVMLSGGYGRTRAGYRYTLPIGDFSRLNLERQASVVEHAFLFAQGLEPATAPAGARMADYQGRTPFPVTGAKD